MTEQDFDLGMVGLGVMGCNLALNMADHGFSVIGYDKDAAKVANLQAAGKGLPVEGTAELAAFVSRLRVPRAVMMLVPAGAPVDAVIRDLLPHLAPGDLVIDGGNSFFKDTELRSQRLQTSQIHYLGVGISGGEEGARHGPSMMPGGPAEAYARVKPIFEAAAAQVDGAPCVTYLGPGSAGHYVKMVHNGIEYGLMQLIAETYDLMKRGLGLTDDELSAVYERWNSVELASYLVEITADIFCQPDDRSQNRLIDVILDEARQKGTGMWTSQEAMDLGVPVPTIDLAVAMRNLSAFKAQRQAAGKLLGDPVHALRVDRDHFLDHLRRALYAGMIVTYAQGMNQLADASQQHAYHLDMEAVARIWRGGCIIRAGLLEQIRAAYQARADLPNLLLDPHLAAEVNARQADLREVIQSAVTAGIPVPGLMACLAYYDALRSAWLPANLIQAQRDYFGAHTYERVDDRGVFHTQWQ